MRQHGELPRVEAISGKAGGGREGESGGVDGVGLGKLTRLAIDRPAGAIILVGILMGNAVLRSGSGVPVARQHVSFVLQDGQGRGVQDTIHNNGGGDP